MPTSPPELLPAATQAPTEWHRAPDANDLENSTVTAASQVTAAWRELFQVTGLEVDINQALLDNTNVQAAAARLAIAEADNRIAAANLWPDARIRFNNQQQQRRNQLQDNEFNATYNGLFTVSWEADIWGRLRQRSAAARADVASAAWELDAARQSLTGNLLITWLNSVENDLLIALTEKNYHNQSRRLAIIERRLDSGLASSLDVRLARNNLATLAARLEQLRLQRARAQRDYALLRGRYPDTDNAPEATLPQLQLLPAISSPALVLQHRPDVLAAEANLEAAGLRVKEAKRNLLPQLSLTWTAGTGNQPLAENLFSLENWLQTLTTQITQPLFQGGALRANVRQKYARWQLALANYRRDVLNAWREAENAWQSEATLQRRETLLDEGLQQARAAETLTERQYLRGLANSFELLAAQNRSINTETDLIRARVERVQNRVRLLLALGVYEE